MSKTSPKSMRNHAYPFASRPPPVCAIPFVSSMTQNGCTFPSTSFEGSAYVLFPHTPEAVAVLLRATFVPLAWYASTSARLM